MIKEKAYTKDIPNNSQDFWVVKRDSHVGHIAKEGYLRKCDFITQSGSYVTHTHLKPYSIPHTHYLRRFVRLQKHKHEVPLRQDWDIVKATYRGKDNIEQDFYELASAWKIQTAHFSTTYHKVNNTNYLKIIGMGEKALPYILRDLEEAPEHWFVALNSIAKPEINPINEEDFGDMVEMSKAWVNWGREKNII